MTIGDWSSASKNSANVAASFQWHMCTCPQGSVRTWSRWVFERTGVAVSMCPYGVRWLSLNLKYVYEIMCNTCHCHCLGSGGRPLGNLNRFLTCLQQMPYIVPTDAAHRIIPLSRQTSIDLYQRITLGGFSSVVPKESSSVALIWGEMRCMWVTRYWGAWI